MGVWEYGRVGGLFGLPYSHTPIPYKRNHYFPVTALGLFGVKAQVPYPAGGAYLVEQFGFCGAGGGLFMRDFLPC